MEKNIRCKKCGANAFHLHRLTSGVYVLKCMRQDGCERTFAETRENLDSLSYC